MGRARNNRRGSQAVKINEDDESVSTVSTAESSLSHESDCDRGGSGIVNEMDGYLELLYEKRSSSREHGLDQLTKAFTSKFQLDFATRKGETILHQCVSIIKKRSASEIRLAAYALGLLAMTVGESETANIFFNESSHLLCCICKQSIDAVSRISALKSLAILTFVVGSGEDNAATLDILWQVGSYNTADHSDMVSGIMDPTCEVRAAALSSWAFLLTTVTRDWFDFGWLEEVFPSLLELLRAEDRVVRLSAGEGIVIIFEHLNKLNLDADGSMSTSAGRNFISENAYEDVISQMKDLSVEAGGKGTSKKELNSQRNLFYDILEYIEGGVVPDISLNLSRSNSLRISTRVQSIQVNMFRNFLGGGFQAHMLGNPFLRYVFDFRPKYSKKQALSNKEKRMYLSPNSVLSKARTKELNKRRLNAQIGNYGHYNIHIDEE